MTLNENKKAPTSAATLERAERNEGGGLSIPASDYTASRADGQVYIADFLGIGKDAAVPRSRLVELTGLDPRTVTLSIERERRDGAPICASCDAKAPGYYLASDPEELHAYIRSLDRRLKNIRSTRNRLADILFDATGQVVIGGAASAEGA